MVDRHAFDSNANLLGTALCEFGIDFRRDQGELIAAIAAGDVFLTALGLQQTAEGGQQRIAAIMALGVVKCLEVVEVQHHHRQRQLATLATCDLARQ